VFLANGDMRSVCSWCYCAWFKVQAGIVLCIFFLHDFALMQLENLHHFSNVCAFGLMRFGIDDLHGTYLL